MDKIRFLNLIENQYENYVICLLVKKTLISSTKSTIFCLILELKCQKPENGFLSRHFVIAMAGAAKLFQFFQKTHQFIGVCPSQANQEHRSIGLKRIIFLIGDSQLLPPLILYSFQTESMIDYAFGFFIAITIVKTIAVYFIWIRQLKNTSKCIRNCEKFIAKSKVRCAFLLIKLFINFLFLFW